MKPVPRTSTPASASSRGISSSLDAKVLVEPLASNRHATRVGCTMGFGTMLALRCRAAEHRDRISAAGIVGVADEEKHASASRAQPRGDGAGRRHSVTTRRLAKLSHTADGRALAGLAYSLRSTSTGLTRSARRSGK